MKTVKVSEWDDKQTGKIREEVSKLKIEESLKLKFRLILRD